MTKEKLKDLIGEYFEQDNRGTRFPIYFTIRDREYEPSIHFEDGDRFTMIWDCESTYTGETLEEMFEQIKKDEDDYNFKIPESIDLDDIDECDCEDFVKANEDCGGIFSEKKVWKKKYVLICRRGRAAFKS